MTTMKHAISPLRSEDYPQWYQQVIRAADLAESSPARGCMIIRPWGYGLWERIKDELDQRIKATGHENAYFPLFIPLSLLQKEADHVEGFAKECAVVTHHRLEEVDGKLIPTGELEEPLIVRPTSETIIGEAYARWVQSYRDLPILINQWANVVRWEMRPRLFLRTAEFLWQEGHTVHADEDEARQEVLRMLEVYREVVEDILAIPVILGEKTENERFPGAVTTLCLEAMMQDRKALQAGTSHYLGQNFSKAANISFLDRDGESKFAHTTSWGVSTRLIGGLIMVHSDDDGLRLPPRVAPKQVVVLPVVPKPEHEQKVFAAVDAIKESLGKCSFFSQKLEVVADKRDIRGGEKNWQWIKKGIPLRIEVGPRDLESNSVMIYRRDHNHKQGVAVSLDSLGQVVPEMLEDIQRSYFDEASRHLRDNTRTDIKSFEGLKEFFTPKNLEKPEIHGGFVLGKWCEDSEVERQLAEMKLTVRCLPLEQSSSSGKCIVTGRPATKDAIIAKAY